VLNSKKTLKKNSCCGSSPPDNIELVISHCGFVTDDKEMSQELYCRCTAIVLLFKAFVQWHSSVLCGFLKLPLIHTYVSRGVKRNISERAGVGLKCPVLK